MTPFSVSDDLSLALALAAEADLVSIDRFRAADLTVDLKPDASHVTDADREVERIIRRRLEAARPDDAVFGEEFGTRGESTRQWIIDPIDGTANYLRGVPIWGTLIALAVDGVPVVGVVSSPALGRRWWAGRGLGAWCVENDGSAHADGRGAARRLRVSGIHSLDEANISYNRIQGWDEDGRLDQLLALTRASWRARAIGDMWSYMLLAEGALDVVVETGLQPYDLAALIPIVEEAGGRFTSLAGEPGPWGGSAAATNGHLHDAVLSLVGDGVDAES